MSRRQRLRQPLRQRLRRVDGPRAAPVACVLAGLLSAVGAVLLDREGGALGAAVATAVVLVFFWTGALPVLLVGGETSRAAIGFFILLMTYALRLVAVLLVLAVAEASSTVDEQWLAMTLIALSLVWTGTQVALVGRSRATL